MLLVLSRNEIFQPQYWLARCQALVLAQAGGLTMAQRRLSCLHTPSHLEIQKTSTNHYKLSPLNDLGNFVGAVLQVQLRIFLMG